MSVDDNKIHFINIYDLIHQNINIIIMYLPIVLFPQQYGYKKYFLEIRIELMGLLGSAIMCIFMKQKLNEGNQQRSSTCLEHVFSFKYKLHAKRGKPPIVRVPGENDYWFIERHQFGTTIFSLSQNLYLILHGTAILLVVCGGEWLMVYIHSFF